MSRGERQAYRRLSQTWLCQKLQATRSKAVVGVLDQGLSSIGNLIATIVIARAATSGEFGAFGVVLSLYLLTTTIGRGMIGAVASIQLPVLAPERRQGYVSSAGSAACLLGVTVAACAAFTTIPLDGALATMLLTFSVAAPLLVLQDVLRFVAHAAGRPGLALANTTAWLVLQMGLFTWLLVSGQAESQKLAAAWALSSIAGCAVGLAGLRPKLVCSGVKNWFSRRNSLVWSLSFEYALISGVVHGVPLVLAFVSGLNSVGALRAAITLFGPLTTVAHGALIALVPVAAQRRSQGRPDYSRQLTTLGIGIGLACGVWAIIGLWIPQAAGTALLGESWRGARGLLLYVGAWLGLGYIAEPAVIRLRITGRNWTAAHVRAVLAPFTILSAAIGGITADAAGAVLAVSGTAAIGAAWLWLAARNTLHPVDR